MRTDNLTITQGATWGVIVPVLNVDGTPADLTGWTVRAQVRERASTEAVLHEWSTALGTATINGGDVTLTVAASVSSAFQWSSGVYDVELVNGPDVHRILRGSVSVDREVTR